MVCQSHIIGYVNLRDFDIQNIAQFKHFFVFGKDFIDHPKLNCVNGACGYGRCVWKSLQNMYDQSIFIKANAYRCLDLMSILSPSRRYVF